MYDTGTTNDFIKKKEGPLQFFKILRLLLQQKTWIIKEIEKKSRALYDNKINCDNKYKILEEYSTKIKNRTEFSEAIRTDIIEYIDEDIHKLVSVMALLGLLEKTSDFVAVWEKVRDKSFNSTTQEECDSTPTPIRTETNNSTATKSESTNTALVFFTAKDLKNYNLTINEAASQIIKNDQMLYGFKDGDANAGTIEQISNLMELYPTNWGFLYHSPSKKIVANYSYCFLDDSLSDLMASGALFGNQVTSRAVKNPIGYTKELTLYIMNISVNPEYHSFDNWQILFEELANSFSYYIQKGVLLNYVLAALFKREFCYIYSNFGFRFITKRMGSGFQEIWGIDLFNGFPSNFSANLAQITRKLEFKQLSYQDFKDGLVGPHHLEDISRLIYDTDPYIYPSMFASRKHAIDVLPRVFATNRDNMFRLDNCFVAFHGDKIVGLILSHQGAFTWDDSTFDSIWEFYSPIEDKTKLQAVKSGYFSVYTEEYLDTESRENKEALILLNFSIQKSLRYNISYGTQLMEHFLDSRHGRIYLRALREVTHDLDIYFSTGFDLFKQTSGFSLTKPNPQCAIMIQDKE